MRKILKKTAIWIRNIILVLFLLSLFFVLLYKWVPVPFTPLMAIRSVEQKIDHKKLHISHQWVPLSKISQNLVQAVVASEDNLFLAHNGFDFEQIEIAQENAAKGKKLRGASTISQQTAKNVFLWNGGGFFRKGLEAYFTILIEFVWGKERIMEVYLNSIEMGDGIFGAEAVAKSHFNKHAANLSEGEAALIAATLPNPIRFNSAKPSPYILKRQAKILSLMKKIIKVDFGKSDEIKKNQPSKSKSKKWKV
ncbi:monofunctional biosynthetic peptidoglycan transglycosylase [Bacteroidia bacterium]|nr:monofunctional biosynthetic peptidoglycan transglycosylase [Bacteroidia bacterium]